MRDTHTGDDCRIPEDDRCVREVVEQPHSAPSNTAARSMWISSSSPASRHCWIVWAPCTPTDFGPAVDFARATALSMPSVTNWTVEPARGQPLGTWWVTTKAGTSHGCWPPQPSADHKARHCRASPAKSVRQLEVTFGLGCSSCIRPASNQEK
jgi:hypothetical protein